MGERSQVRFSPISGDRSLTPLRSVRSGRSLRSLSLSPLTERAGNPSSGRRINPCSEKAGAPVLKNPKEGYNQKIESRF